jgi:hypothetical protein
VVDPPSDAPQAADVLFDGVTGCKSETDRVELVLE